MKTRADLVKIDNVFEKENIDEVCGEKKLNIFSRFFSNKENIVLVLFMFLIVFMFHFLLWGVNYERRLLLEEYQATVAPKMLNAQIIKEYKDGGKTLAGLGWTYESPDKLMKASSYRNIYGVDKHSVEFALNDKVKLSFNNLGMFEIEKVDSKNCDGVCNYIIKDGNGNFREIKRADLAEDFENYSLLEFKDNVLINEYPLPSLKEYNLRSYFVHKNVGGEDYKSLLNELEASRKFFLNN